MSDTAQTLLDKFYALDNLVTIEVVMKDADWTTLATTGAAWGWRRMATVEEARDDIPPKYNYFDTTSVAISGSKYPTRRKSVPFVGIIKKSFGGSASKSKPSIKLNFGRAPSNASKADSDAAKETKAAIEALIGTHNVTLNNCKQDKSYIRQPLGYHIFRQGAIPAARCNFARVIIRGTSQEPTDKPLFSGVYVNLEQPREPYLRRNFADNDEGNLYETEWGFDLNPKYFAAPLFNANDIYPDQKKDQRKNYDYNGVSPYEDQKDLYLATTELTKCVENKDLNMAKKFVDWNQLLHVIAMQTLVRHWDGYPNNAFIYNDVAAVAEPTVANINLKLIPSGIDQILQESTRPLKVKSEGLLTDLLFMTEDTTMQLKKTLQTCAAAFATNLAANLKLIDAMETLLLGALTDSDTPTPKASVSHEIDKVRDAMKNVKNDMADLLSDANWPRTTVRDDSFFTSRGF